MGFSIIFKILRLVSGLKFIFHGGNTNERMGEMIQKIKSIARDEDLSSILGRLERDDRFRNRVSTQIEKMYRSNAKYKMISKDMISARKRDAKIRATNACNPRADLIMWFALIGIIGSIGSLIYLKDHLNCEVTLIFAGLIHFFSSIVNDVSLFEFGNNFMRIKKRVQS